MLFCPSRPCAFPMRSYCICMRTALRGGCEIFFSCSAKGDPCQGKAILLWLWLVSRPLESMSRGFMSCNGFPFARLGLCSCRTHYKLIDIILGTFTGHLQWHVVHGNGLRSYESPLVGFWTSFGRF